MNQKMQKYLKYILIITTILLAGVGCGVNNANDTVATLNAIGTQAASGEVVQPGNGGQIDLPFDDNGQSDQMTAVPNLIDITGNPDARLIGAWEQVNVLPSIEAFTVVATENQVGAMVVQWLQVNGWSSYVQDGTVTIGQGQIRIDLTLIDSNGDKGPGIITFQPTLTSTYEVKLNPLGGNFGTLKLPNGLTGAFGDAVMVALTGAPDVTTTRVTIHLIQLDNGQLKISGIHR